MREEVNYYSVVNYNYVVNCCITGITLGEIQLSGVISSMDTVPDQTSDDTGNGRIRVGEDGDIVEEGIDEIIGQNSSDDDDDEGEEGKLVIKLVIKLSSNIHVTSQKLKKVN